MSNFLIDKICVGVRSTLNLISISVSIGSNNIGSQKARLGSEARRRPEIREAREKDAACLRRIDSYVLIDMRVVFLSLKSVCK